MTCSVVVNVTVLALRKVEVAVVVRMVLTVVLLVLVVMTERVGLFTMVAVL